MVLALYALLAPPAWGGPFLTQHLQLFHKPDLDDVGAAVDDDYIVSNNPRPAAFASVTLFKNGVIQAFGQTDEDGLVTFTNVDAAADYSVRLQAQHDYQNSGRDFYVRDALGGNIMAATMPYNPPAVSVTTTLIYDAAVSSQKWINLAAVGYWMIARRPAAWPTNATYLMVLQAPPSPYEDFVGLYDIGDTVTYINPNDRGGYASKYVIAHEFAHQLQNWVIFKWGDPGGTLGVVSNWGQESDYDATDDCLNEDPDSHYMVSKEFQSAAINEGMADWLAAITFNQTDENDCRLKPYGNFLWLDGTPPDDGQFSCQGWNDNNNTGDNGGAEWTGYGIDAFDYLGDYCNIGTTTDRGTELDWLRFFFDLDRTSSGGESMNVADILDLYADADPYDWDTSTSARPALFNAFDAADEEGHWNNQDHNGIFR